MWDEEEQEVAMYWHQVEQAHFRQVERAKTENKQQKEYVMRNVEVSRLGAALHPDHSLECRQCGEEYYGKDAKSYLAEVGFVNADGKDEVAHVCGGRCLDAFLKKEKATE